MSGEEVVADSNLLIGLLKGDARIRRALRGKKVHVSFITEVEVLAWPGATEQDAELMTELSSQCVILDAGPVIKATTVHLRKTARMKLPDCFVAATAIRLNVPLLTSDRGFMKIAHLVEVRVV